MRDENTLIMKSDIPAVANITLGLNAEIGFPSLESWQWYAYNQQWKQIVQVWEWTSNIWK